MVEALLQDRLGRHGLRKVQPSAQRHNAKDREREAQKEQQDARVQDRRRMWDILVANVEVAWIVLTRPNSKLHPAWVVIPLDLKQPEAISILAGTITLTPGTVSADMSDGGHSLLVHALDAPDPDAVRDQIKNRYERRLKEIFA